MMTRYACALDGIALNSISDAIFITDIAENAPRVRRTTMEYPTRDGLRVLRENRQSIGVTVTFEIHEQSVTRRKGICQQVQSWAQPGGFLTINDRPEQRLRVRCDTLPLVGSSLRWTQALSIIFTAYLIPYWEDETETVVTLNGNTSQNINVPGTAGETRVRATMKNTGTAAITNARITAGDTFMAFDGIQLPAGGALTIGYDEPGRLLLRVGETSIYARRTPESSDDLLLASGQVSAVSVSANGTTQTTVGARGLYL